jgi:hypothetical protein
VTLIRSPDSWADLTPADIDQARQAIACALPRT